MAGEHGALLRSIQRLFQEGPVSGLDERGLLERFVTRRDEAAFAALVARHGPLVLGACRRVLREPHDVEDAFQATFLILMMRAKEVRDPGRLGPWLYGVARRVALRARADAARRREHEREHAAASGSHPVEADSQVDRQDVLRVIDEEVDRLPARYRAAVVLCDLEGLSYAEAAGRLRCPQGTVQSRLARGRARLQDRLSRRGLAPVGLAFPLVGVVPEVVSPALVEATVRSASAVALGRVAAAGAVPAAVATLVNHVARAMTMTKVGTVAVALTTLSLALGAAFLARGALPAADPPAVTEPQKPAPAAQPGPSRTLDLKVVRADDRAPLPGAAVWVRTTSGQDHESRARCDSQGRTPVVFPAETTYILYVVVTHPGFVPIELRWSGTEVPASYTLALERGVTIGGTVRDEQGRPIAGARVFPCITLRAPRGDPEMYTSRGDPVAAITDAQGRWRADALPASALPDVKVTLRVTHPDFVMTKVPSLPTITAAEARALTSVVVLKHGVSLSGTVLAPDGRPVAGANVVAERSPGEGEYERLATDGEGRFHSGHVLDPTWPDVVLSVQAPGFASVVRQVAVTPAIPMQLIQLAPRKPLRGRVVDVQGRPVAGAAVGATQHLRNGQLAWDTVTDADGRFEWRDAPASGTILLDAYKAPFTQALGREFQAGSGEVTIALHRPIRLHGTVTDAETGRAIDRFVIIPGWGPDQPGGQPDWLRNGAGAKNWPGGRFNLDDGLFPDQGYRRSIRVEAEGYQPAELLGFRDDAEDVAHDFKLLKARPLSGVVHGTDGRPLAGAEVSLIGRTDHPRLKNGRLVTNLTVGTATHTLTGPDGRYTFPARETGVGLVVLHDAGFAIRAAADLAASLDVTVAPWGRIEGTLRVGPRPVARSKVEAVWNDRWIIGRVDCESLTDEAGRCVFERVAPGRQTVYCYVSNPNNHGWTPSNPVSVEVAPGQTVRVDIGGQGRPVVGRLVVPPGIALSKLVGGLCALRTERRECPHPEDYFDWPDDRQSDWVRTWHATPEGRAFFASERMYAIILGSDGSFRAEDVPAGRYLLNMPFTSRTSGDQTGRLGLARAVVNVPPIPGGRSDEPLDIGAVPLDVFPRNSLKVGDLAPALTTGAADGRPLDLGALRGKYVLLAFWATWRAQTLAVVTPLKATYDASGRDPRLVMIGLSMDATADISKRYAARHGLAFDQRHLGAGDDPNRVAAAFGVRYPPQILLIGPDGRVVAKDLEGDGIAQAVASALARKN